MKYSRIHTTLRKLSARAGLPSFRGVGVSKRRTQAAALVLRLMGRPATSSAVSCAGLKRPCTGPYLEGRAKKDISMLGSLGSVTNSHRASANGQERHLFKELTCYRKLTFTARVCASFDPHHGENRLEGVEPAKMVVGNQKGKTEKRYLRISLGHRTICFPLRR